MAGLFSTTHHEVVVTADDFLNNWYKLSWYRDGPLSEPADVAIYRLAQLAREQVKVVLSGEGSDEFRRLPEVPVRQRDSLVGWPSLRRFPRSVGEEFAGQ